MAKDGKGKLSGLKNLFFEVQEEKSETETSSAPQTSVSTQTNQSNVFDKNIYDQLLKVLTDNNMEGYDYFEFRNSLDNMKNVIPDEVGRFKAAYAAVSSIVTSEKLTSSALFYLSKLEDKRVEFERYVQEVIDTKVTARESDANKIKQTIVDKQQQIAKLNEEINSLQQVSVQKSNDAISEKAKIDTVKNNFMSTFNKVVSEINSDINKIKTYLTQGK